MLTGIAAAAYYIIKSSFYPAEQQTVWDLYLAAYGLGTIALYVLIYGFDWK
jgi:hypothetical protein